MMRALRIITPWKTTCENSNLHRLATFCLAISSVIGWASAATALEFTAETIPLAADQKVAFMPYLSGDKDPGQTAPMLLVIETPDLDEREKQALGLEEPVRTVTLFRQNGQGWERYLRTELDGAMDLVDTVQRQDGIALAGYRRSQVLVLQESTATFQPMISARSMYIGSNWDASPTIDMFLDLNEDGLDDFLMPDFDGWQVALQEADGFQDPQTLGPGPRMDFSESSEMVGFRAETPHVFDANGDGRKDLAFWINGRFQIYEQGPEGRFAEEAITLDPDMNDVLGSFLSVEFGEGGDEETDQPQRLLDAVGDVNGDGFADLIIQAMEGDGIFGLETSYQIHRGQPGREGALTFERTASSVVGSDGIQLENERLDLTGDGQLEFVVTSVDITLGAIISALLTRSASVDVAIHRMEDGRFTGEPRLRKKIKVRFDFSEGELFVPAVLSADVNGDGRKDLLVQRDEDTLLVYPGEASERLFEKNAVKLELMLPKEPEGFVATDLNGDGRDELILHVRREDRSLLSVIEFES